MVFVHVGFGFFVEFTHKEALKFIEKKSAQLTEDSEQLTKDASKVKATIKMVIEVGPLQWMWEGGGGVEGDCE